MQKASRKPISRRGIQHGSVYPGPDKYQDRKYAAVVAESQKKARQAVKVE